MFTKLYSSQKEHTDVQYLHNALINEAYYRKTSYFCIIVLMHSMCNYQYNKLSIVRNSIHPTNNINICYFVSYATKLTKFLCKLTLYVQNYDN